MISDNDHGRLTSLTTSVVLKQFVTLIGDFNWFDCSVLAGLYYSSTVIRLAVKSSIINRNILKFQFEAAWPESAPS